MGVLKKLISCCAPAPVPVLVLHRDIMMMVVMGIWEQYGNVGACPYTYIPREPIRDRLA